MPSFVLPAHPVLETFPVFATFLKARLSAVDVLSFIPVSHVLLRRFRFAFSPHVAPSSTSTPNVTETTTATTTAAASGKAFARTAASCGAKVALTSSVYDHAKKVRGVWVVCLVQRCARHGRARACFACGSVLFEYNKKEGGVPATGTTTATWRSLFHYAV